ncbi:VPS20 [Acrasis kona]|uniref:VPS20 n=1 Tax=Acrasis kona TaxID=1008807 RepID=A0AAW2ZFR3_9EUKA
MFDRLVLQMLKNAKRGLLRGSQSIKRKIGKSERIADAEYDAVKGESERLENCLATMNMHLALLDECFTNLSKTMSNVRQDIDAYQSLLNEVKARDIIPHQTVRYDNNMLRQLHALQAQLDAMVIAPTTTLLRNTLIEPIKSDLENVRQIHPMHSQYQKSELEFDYYREKVAQFDPEKNKKPDALPMLQRKMDQKQQKLKQISDSNKGFMVQTLISSHRSFDALTNAMVEMVCQLATNICAVTQPKPIRNDYEPYPRLEQSTSSVSYSSDVNVGVLDEPKEDLTVVKLKVNYSQ